MKIIRSLRKSLGKCNTRRHKNRNCRWYCFLFYSFCLVFIIFCRHTFWSTQCNKYFQNTRSLDYFDLNTRIVENINAIITEPLWDLFNICISKGFFPDYRTISLILITDFFLSFNKINGSLKIQKILLLKIQIKNK